MRSLGRRRWSSVPLVLATSGFVVAGPVGAQTLVTEPDTKVSGGFEVIYSRGSFVPQATTSGPARPADGQLPLDGSYTDLARLGRVSLGLDQRLNELASLRLSGILFSSDIADQPLTNKDLADYAGFLRQRWLGGTPLWSRPFLLGDVYFRMVDPRFPGSELILGQHWVPFGYQEAQTILPPITIAPQHTPLGEYVNGQRLANNLVPWQISAASRQRQLGSSVKAQYGPVRLTTGLYTGAGPTQADDNGALDYLARVDYVNDGAEAGVSFWRGTQPGFRTQGAAATPYDRTLTGAHVQLPYGDWKLTGEYLLRWDSWHDGPTSASRGGYLTLAVPLDPFSQLAAQGAYIEHDAPFDGALTGFGALNTRQATLSYQRRIGDYAEWQSDVAYTWEDLAGAQPTGIHYAQFLTKVRIGF